MSSYCIVCNKPLLKHLESVIDPLTRESFSIETCMDCGLGHTLPSPEIIERYYGPIYYSGRHGFSSQFCAKRRARLVSSIMGEGGEGSLLDVGCGDGAFLLEIAKKGWQCAGTERNPALPRETGLIVEESIGEIRPAGPFECVTFWHSLEHMSNPISVLTEISDVLTPSGKLLVAVPDNGGFQAKIFKHKWFHLDVPRHLYHFNYDALSRLLTRTGFRITHCYHQEFEYDLMGWIQSALNSILPNPNFLFNLIAGKKPAGSASEKALHWVLGMMLSLMALPSVAAGSLLGRGGTLIVAAELGRPAK
jgi:SAM-dependent methyltransferase